MVVMLYCPLPADQFPSQSSVKVVRKFELNSHQVGCFPP